MTDIQDGYLRFFLKQMRDMQTRTHRFVGQAVERFGAGGRGDGRPVRVILPGVSHVARHLVEERREGGEKRPD